MIKYRFTGETMQYCGRTLYRIISVRKFGMADNNQVGGWVEHGYNLSHDGDCWITHEAKAIGNAKVIGDGYMLHESIAKDNCIIDGLARIENRSCISGNAIIRGSSHIYNSDMSGNTLVEGKSRRLSEASGNTYIVGNKRNERGYERHIDEVQNSYDPVRLLGPHGLTFKDIKQ